MNSHTPYGKCLQTYYNGDDSASFLWELDDRTSRELSASVFFRSAEELELERAALERVKGRVLDVGAGAGPHSLELQRRGFAVTAIDLAHEAVEVMRRRGVHDVRCIDVFAIEGEVFDTVLILGRTIGLVGDLSGLDAFLAKLRTIVRSGGRVLLTSLEPLEAQDDFISHYVEKRRARGIYPGVLRFRVIFRDCVGPWTTWLHVDFETLSVASLRSGWNANVITSKDDGNYLAELCLE